MSRFSPNCRVMRVAPTVLDEVISVTSAICPRWRSSGLATVVATSCGLAPGRVACTEIVGKSTCGSGDTGNLKNATAPAAARPKVSNVVATGRRMKGVDGPMTLVHFVRCAGFARRSGKPRRQPVEPEIDHRRRKQGQQLTDQKAADDGNAKRVPQLGTRTRSEH